MRFVEIWLFMVILNISLGMVYQYMNPLELGLSTGPEIYDTNQQVSMSTESYINNTISSELTSVAAASNTNWISTIFNAFGAVFYFTFLMMPKLILSIVQAVVMFPVLWVQLGVPYWIAWYLLAPICYFIEGMAIYQIATGRSFREGQ